MKKKTTQVSQPDKTETANVELFIVPTNSPKMYRDHKVCNHHTHGRTNKFPFGSSNGPNFFKQAGFIEWLLLYSLLFSVLIRDLHNFIRGELSAIK